VVHVLQVKLDAGFKGVVSAELPSNSLQYPVSSASAGSSVEGIPKVTHVLARWSELPKSLATWEDKKSLQQRFSGAAARGQAAPQDPGNVSTIDVVPMGPRRGSRPRKANPAVVGPEWKS
jgi:hypothetical protein